MLKYRFCYKDNILCRKIYLVRRDVDKKTSKNRSTPLFSSVVIPERSLPAEAGEASLGFQQ